jgi:hypothetical protein
MIREDVGDGGRGIRTDDGCDHHAVREDVLGGGRAGDVVELGGIDGCDRACAGLDGGFDTLTRRVV